MNNSDKVSSSCGSSSSDLNFNIQISSVQSLHSKPDRSRAVLDVSAEKEGSNQSRHKLRKKECPYCHHMISAGNLRRHINLKHSTEKVEVPNPEDCVKVEIKREMKVCGDCGLDAACGSVIHCGDCQELYHIACVEITEDEFPNPEFFQCSHCRVSSSIDLSVHTEDSQMVEQFTCSICEKRSFTQRSGLYRHYAEFHFYDKLKKFINEDELSCKICGVELKRLPYLVCHVGATHDKVEEFLPLEHLVPRKLAWSHFQEGSGYECAFCPKSRKFGSKLKLYCHLSRCHFKEEIQPLIDEDKIQCLLCGLKMTRLNTLMSHVGVSHNKIEEFLGLPWAKKEPEISEETDSNSFFRDPMSVVKVCQDDVKEESEPLLGTAHSASGEFDRDVTEERTRHEGIQCHLCPWQNTFLNRKRLYRHYSQSHFKKRIMRLLGEDQLQCPVCDHVALTVSDIVVHLGSVHDRVDQFLEKEFRIPRPRKRPIVYIQPDGIPVKKKPKFIKSEKTFGTVKKIKITKSDGGLNVKEEEESLSPEGAEVVGSDDKPAQSSLELDLYLTDNTSSNSDSETISQEVKPTSE